MMKWDIIIAKETIWNIFHALNGKSIMNTVSSKYNKRNNCFSVAIKI